MNKCLCFPDGKAYPVEELEKLLNFKYLAQNIFESPEGQQEIRERGLKKLEAGGVSAEAQELGCRFIEKIKGAYLPEVSIRYLNEALGYGLFLEEPLECGSYVGEYCGIVRENDLRRYFEPINHYSYEYPVLDALGKNYIIDASQGNLTRFINHSFDPNLKSVFAFYNGFYHCIFLANQRIEKGTQLCFNYGQSYWNLREPPLPLMPDQNSK